MFYVYLTIFAAAIVAVDQWTKALAAAQLTDVVDVLIPGWLELRSVNPYYPPRRFEGEALERVRLLGPVAESRRRYL